MGIEEPEPGEEARARKRAAFVLGSLALVAVLLTVLIAIFLGNSSGPSPKSIGQSIAGQGPTWSKPAAHISSAPARSSRSSRAESSTSAPPRRHRRSSRSASHHRAASVPGDTGKVLEALNAFRTQHGIRAVAGDVTAAAKTCAAAEGSSSACPTSYFWEPVTGADGRAVVQKITTHPDGTSWLLDPQMKRVEIGWDRMGSGGWQCALIAGY